MSGSAGSGSTSGEEGSHSGDTILLDVAIGGFAPVDLEASEGEIALTLANLDAFPHDFTIDELDVQVLMDANETVDAAFEAPPGVYTFYCSIPGHREAGMEGTLTVP